MCDCRSNATVVVHLAGRVCIINNNFLLVTAFAKLIPGIAGENSRSIHVHGRDYRLTRLQEPRDSTPRRGAYTAVTAGFSLICLYYAGYIAPNWLSDATTFTFFFGNEK